MQQSGSIVIDRRIEDVFPLTLNHVKEWSKVVVDDEVIEATPDVIGTQFRMVTGDRGQRMEFLGIVTEHDPPYYSACQMVGKHFDMKVYYTFEANGERTTVTQESEITGKGPFRIILFLMGWLMKSASNDAIQVELKRLKKFCETYEGEIIEY